MHEGKAMADSDIEDRFDPLIDWWKSPLGDTVLKQEQQLFHRFVLKSFTENYFLLERKA